MSAEKPVVAIDARMIRHSGIGVVLRALLRQWDIAPPPFTMYLLGNPWVIAPEVPKSLDAKMVAWNKGVYSVGAALSPPRLRNLAAWYSPHYATCLMGKWPLVCHVQDILHITHPTRRGTRVYNALYLEALRRRAAFTLTTSRHVKVQLQTLHHFDASRVLRTGLGPGLVLEHDDDDASPSVLPRELHGKPYLLSVGIYKFHKNWEYLFDRLRSPDSGDLPLLCVGAGKDQKTLAQLARDKGLGNRVYTIPHVQDRQMAAIYRHATGLIFPSVAEGFGLPILEAMTLGTPVLIADRSPMKEIADGTAFTFDPDRPESFDAALQDMLQDQEKRNRLIQAAQVKASAFTWRKTADSVEAAIMRAIDGKLGEAHP